MLSLCMHACVWVHVGVEGGSTWKEVLCPYTSCNDCCIVHPMVPVLIQSCSMVVVVCNCMLSLHPAPTCADAGPDLCMLHPDLWRKYSTCTRSGISLYNLHWCFSFHWHKYYTCTLWWWWQLYVIVYVYGVVVAMRQWWFNSMHGGSQNMTKHRKAT